EDAAVPRGEIAPRCLIISKGRSEIRFMFPSIHHGPPRWRWEYWLAGTSVCTESPGIHKDFPVLTWFGTHASRPQSCPQDNLIRAENGSPQILFQSLDTSNGTETIPTYEDGVCVARDIRFDPQIHFGRRNFSECPLRCHPLTKCDFKSMISKIIFSLG